ncbi:MAG: PadR family transcriptional regulator [Verrucomicrobiota bacterium]
MQVSAIPETNVMSSSGHNQEAWEVQVRKGLLDYITLKILSVQPLHGYGIVQKIRDYPSFTVTESAIYPVLSKFLKEQVLTTTSEVSLQGPPRRVYYLTALGKTRLISMEHFIKSMNLSLENFLQNKI